MLGISLIYLESLISFFVVLLLRKSYSHCCNISHVSRCYHLFVTPTQAISIFLLKTTYCCFMSFTIFYVKVVWKQPWRDFLLNRLNLLIFNIIFTSNLGKVLGSSSLWEFMLVRQQTFGLRFYCEWAPTRVFLDLCCDVQNYLFCRTPLVGCSHLSLFSGSISLVFF